MMITKSVPSHRRSVRLVLACLAATLAASPTQAAAAADDADVTEYKTISALAILTDCPSSGPAGLRCTGIVVRANSSKNSFAKSTALSVQLYDVEFLGPGFRQTLIGTGFSEVADISINDSLQRAAADGVIDVQTCTFDPTAPEPTCTTVRTIDLSVRWTGIGDVSRTHTDESFEFGPCVVQLGSHTAHRGASVSASIDGAPMGQSSLPQFAPRLDSFKSTQTVTCS